MLRPILIHPNPKLKKVCEPVLEIDDALIELSADMLETMYHAPGIGLAAPQIGVITVSYTHLTLPTKRIV